ncbi:hypothetical protein FisN_11Lh296 [Fistulifera solaris]|uniref:Uncharacterized protein n=1 Tax=Fistulifera solaris TaxID=1519565 RepID=A0A1Z5K0J5_FISSO|nr:hypothetical protein FisN_11Lh296 [Fistulifera solaris]|eukprot:GAX19833.1 hypothetical protein FisN_11Lh296 [Fistulifera solaris]
MSGPTIKQAYQANLLLIDQRPCPNQHYLCPSNKMIHQEAEKNSRSCIALGSAILLFAAATVGFYYNSSFETLLDRSMLHQCNGPARGIKLTPDRPHYVAAIVNPRIFYIPTPTAELNNFCSCEVECETGFIDLYMTDHEGFWTFPDFINNWVPEEEYECISSNKGNAKETCQIRGVGDEWYCYIMIKAKVPASRCAIECSYVVI